MPRVEVEIKRPDPDDVVHERAKWNAAEDRLEMLQRKEQQMREDLQAVEREIQEVLQVRDKERKEYYKNRGRSD